MIRRCLSQSHDKKPLVRTQRCIVDNVGESENENDAKWRAGTSLLELVDVVKPMVEVDGARRAATSLLELMDVV